MGVTGTTETDSEMTQTRAKAVKGRHTSARQARPRQTKQRKAEEPGTTERSKAARGRGARRERCVESILCMRKGQGERSRRE